MLIETGFRIFMAAMQVLLVVIRLVMKYLPAKESRSMSVIEDNLSFIAYDGDKLMLPGHKAILACLGWGLVYILLFDSILSIIKEIKGF